MAFFVLAVYSILSVVKGELGQLLTHGIDTGLEYSVVQTAGGTRIVLRAERHLDCKIELKLEVKGTLPAGLPVSLENGELVRAQATTIGTNRWLVRIFKPSPTGLPVTYVSWENRDRLIIEVPRKGAKVEYWAIAAKDGADDTTRAATRLLYRRWTVAFVALFILASFVQATLAFRKDIRSAPAEETDRLRSLISLVILGVKGESVIETDRRRDFLRKRKIELKDEEKALDAIPVADRGAFSVASHRAFREQADLLARTLADLKEERL